MVEHLVYASSSSVYGLNKEMPFHEGQNVDHPLALYGDEKANELLAHSYSHHLAPTGLTIFYRLWPMGAAGYGLAITDAILSSAYKIFNHGKMKRDFTYIDDIVEGMSCCDKTRKNPEFNRKPRRWTSGAPFRVLILAMANQKFN